VNIFSNVSSKAKLGQDVSDPEIRHLLVDAQIRQGLPLQLRAMREDRGWTQAKLAEKLGTTQNAISRFENPKSRPATIPTLKRIAETFDVALMVKFAPFSEFVDSVSNISEKSVSVPAYNSKAEEHERTMQSQMFDWTAFLYRSAHTTMALDYYLPGQTFMQKIERPASSTIQEANVVFIDSKREPRLRVNSDQETLNWKSMGVALTNNSMPGWNTIGAAVNG